MTPWQFLYKTLRRYRLTIVYFIILQFIEVFLTKALAFYFTDIINHFQDHTLLLTEPLFIQKVGILCGLIILKLLSYWLDYTAISVFIIKADTHIFQKATLYVLHHSPKYFMVNHSGTLSDKIQRLGNETLNLIQSIAPISWGVFNLMITLTWLFFINIFIGMTALVMGIITIIVFSRNGRKVGLLYQKQGETYATYNGHLIDSISNASLIQSFGNIKAELHHLTTQFKAIRHIKKTTQNTARRYRIVQDALVDFFKISLFLLALIMWQKGQLALGSLVLVSVWTTELIQLFYWVIDCVLNTAKTLGGLSSALEIINTPIDLKDMPHAKNLKVQKGQIVFQNVDFSYSPDKPLFHHLNLTIQAGEKVGLVGISGSGKTTFINLLQRFFDPQAGRILIDGQDIKTVRQLSLHQAISVIPQDTYLFHRTLRENIIYGLPQATESQMLRATKAAFAHQFIQTMPEGYETMVGERGVRLSGGQRQRIAIARAFLRKAPICILDEATSALDSESEYYIHKSMTPLFKGKTVIVIAHRLSTLKEMDRIIVFKNGRIIEQGTPEELLKNTKGGYARLWHLQTLNM